MAFWPASANKLHIRPNGTRYVSSPSYVFVNTLMVVHGTSDKSSSLEKMILSSSKAPLVYRSFGRKDRNFVFLCSLNERRLNENRKKIFTTTTTGYEMATLA